MGAVLRRNRLRRRRRTRPKSSAPYVPRSCSSRCFPPESHEWRSTCCSHQEHEYHEPCWCPDTRPSWDSARKQFAGAPHYSARVRPYLRHDRGRSLCYPRRTRRRNVLLLWRPLPARISVCARADEARGRGSWLLWIISTRTSPAIVARNEFVSASSCVTTNQMRTQEREQY